MKIVALIDSMTVEQDKKFIDFLSAKKWGYWHWIDGAWLVTSVTRDPRAPETIRDQIQTIAPGKHSLIFEVSSTANWAGFGPNAEKKNMFKWIKDNWK